MQTQRELLEGVVEVAADPRFTTVEALLAGFRDPGVDLTPAEATALLAAEGRAGTA